MASDRTLIDARHLLDVQPGRFADLVVVGADPLLDIEVLRSPVAVVKDGSLVAAG